MVFLAILFDECLVYNDTYLRFRVTVEQLVQNNIIKRLNNTV